LFLVDLAQLGEPGEVVLVEVDDPFVELRSPPLLRKCRAFLPHEVRRSRRRMILGFKKLGLRLRERGLVIGPCLADEREARRLVPDQGFQGDLLLLLEREGVLHPPLRVRRRRRPLTLETRELLLLVGHCRTALLFERGEFTALVGERLLDA
jgi:hypothetical protein